MSSGRLLTTHTLLNLGKLDASDRSITDLTGLEHALNLQELFLDGNQVSDLRPLKALKNLRSLFLNRNQVSDLRPLKALIELQHPRSFREQYQRCVRTLRGSRTAKPISLE